MEKNYNAFSLNQKQLFSKMKFKWFTNSMFFQLYVEVILHS